MTAPVSIPEMFSRQVDRDPGAPALTFDDRLAVVRRARRGSPQAGNLLALMGAGPAKPWRCWRPGQTWAIVAILAVLKTGAAYLPIDPAVPATRLEFMLSDAAPIIAITTAELRSRPESADVQIVEIDDPAVESAD